MNNELVYWDVDDSGEVIEGAFFDLSMPRFIPGKPAGKDGEFVGGLHFGYDRAEYVNSSMITDVIDNDSHWEPCPSRGDKHERPARPENFEYLAHNDRFAPFVWSTTGFCVRGDVAKQIMNEKFTGLAFLEAKCDAKNPLTRRVFLLDARGKDLRVRTKFTPPFENKCGDCGAQMVCFECGRPIHGRCPKSNRLVYLFSDDPLPEQGFALVFTNWRTLGDVLDASSWDGSDFSEGKSGWIVTPRVIRTLIKRDLFPFSYRPLRAYVGSCTKDERDRLNRMRLEGP